MRYMKTGVALLAVLIVSNQALDARQRARPGWGAARGHVGTEQILRAREQLNLTAAQVAGLDALRRSTLETRRAHMGEMMELRSRIQAGDTAARAEMRTLAESRREALGKRLEEYENRINGILTEEQQGLVRSLGRRQMAGRHRFQGRSPRGFRGQGRRGVRPQQRFRGRAPGWNRGGRGRGSGQPGFRRGRRRPPDSESEIVDTL